MKKNKGYDLLNATIKREQLFGVPPEKTCSSCGQIENTHSKGYFFCPEGREDLFGIPPEEQLNFPQRNFFTVHKSAKKGQTSFRITKSLLESLFETQSKIQKKPTLVITIQDGSNEYTITCSISKTTR